MATANLSPFKTKLDATPLKLATNPAKPVVYVSNFKDGAIICDPQHDRLFRLNRTAVEMWKLLSVGKTNAELVDAMVGGIRC
jgi:hypothetical protein